MQNKLIATVVEKSCNRVWTLSVSL